MTLRAAVYTANSPERPVAILGLRSGVATVLRGDFGDGSLEPLYDAGQGRKVTPADGEDYLRVLADTYHNAYVWVTLRG